MAVGKISTDVHDASRGPSAIAELLVDICCFSCVIQPQSSLQDIKYFYNNLDKIWHGGRYPRHSHLHKFCRPSVEGFLGGGGSNPPVPTDFHRRAYNTLALPCECVMMKQLTSYYHQD